MNKKLLTLLACAGIASSMQANDVVSHTFYLIRPPFWSESPERVSLWRDAAYARCDGWGAAFQVVPFGGRSTKSDALNKYFLFCGRSELRVLESNNGAQTNPARDPQLRQINPAHFNIYTQSPNSAPFASTISFSPRHTFYGVGFTYQHHFGCDKKWWWEIGFPVMGVKNDMRLQEDVVETGTPFAVNSTQELARNKDMKEAFTGVKPLSTRVGGVSSASTPWQYGKIDGSHKRWGVADIELKLGEDLVCEETCHMGGYVGLVLPTGNRSKAVNVFEPMIGRGHFGFMLGVAAGFEVWCGCDSTVRWELNGVSRYLLSNTQTRSFDVKGKSWSRYMMVFANQTDAANNAPSYGINVFTQKVNVKPRFEYNVNSAFVYERCSFQGEVGYNFYARQAECVKLKAPWIEGPAFVNLATSTLQGQPGFTTTAISTINRASTIGEDFGGVNPPNPNAGVTASAQQYSTLLIKEQDLDLASAAAPCALTNTIYASLGYVLDDCWCYPMRFGLGGSYEFSGENAGLNRWMVWGKWVVSL